MFRILRINIYTWTNSRSFQKCLSKNINIILSCEFAIVPCVIWYLVYRCTLCVIVSCVNLYYVKNSTFCRLVLCMVLFLTLVIILIKFYNVFKYLYDIRWKYFEISIFLVLHFLLVRTSFKHLLIIYRLILKKGMSL